ncbi:BrnA antitoxin family protein [Pararhodospirillum oryzae]|uniref:BrnA antitoxin family protein n=1 Tax=Pararhodospirillum oryzae TaxID=478448 RepID=UPI0027D957A0|nr:BrnA antitoxin family protein [Pararhodospirillum oryzae]
MLCSGPKSLSKGPLTLRLDADVVEWLHQGEEGYQTRINAALRDFTKHHRS